MTAIIPVMRKLAPLLALLLLLAPSALAQRVALWPVGEDESGSERWREWLKSEGFDALALVDRAQSALDWIANGNATDA